MEASIVIRKEVLRALETGRPIVALESSFIAQGMPYPDGVTCALDLMKVILECNAEPAVIGVLEGAVRVGLNQTQIDYIGSSDEVRKVSRRDLAAVVASGQPGATTVSELAALGKPSILIPYPYAANSHQKTNALALARSGGARMILQEDLSGGKLADLLEGDMNDRGALEEMGRQARTVGRHNAAEVIVDRLEELVSDKACRRSGGKTAECAKK